MGRDVTNRNELRDAKQHLGYLPSDVAFYDRVTGADILDHCSRLRVDERREELLERFPVPLDRNVKDYSSGNRQSLPSSQRSCTVLNWRSWTNRRQDWIRSSRTNSTNYSRNDGKRAGRTSSPHILSEVRRVCDRVGSSGNGRLIELDTVENILAEGGTIATVRLAEEPPTAALEFRASRASTDRTVRTGSFSRESSTL